VKFRRKLKRPITLVQLKRYGELSELILIRPGNRLSVFPVSRAHWDFILALE
jgi:predicted RNA-binding protein with PUA-like domain